MALRNSNFHQFTTVSDLFTLKDGTVTPGLKAADPPVRANVLHMRPEYSLPISMFHASHHIAPVPAAEEEIEVEVSAVKAVADDICPLHIILDRVVLTSTGVLLGCWQMVSGTDLGTIRAKLRSAFPRSPERQLVRTTRTSFLLSLSHSR